MNIKNILYIIIIMMILVIPVSATNNVTLSNPDIDLKEGQSVDVTVMVMDALNVSGLQTVINYDPTVINITSGVEGSDFDYGTFFDYRIPGQLSVYAIRSNDTKSGDLFVGKVTIEAIGSRDDNSAITFNSTVGCDNYGYYEQFTNINGFIRLISSANPPSVFNPLVDHAIPNDTDNTPMWGETATISVDCYIAGEDGIDNATIDLSQMEGDSAVPMTLVVNNTNNVVTASVEITAPASTYPDEYVLPVTVTTYDGGITVVDSIRVTVLCNGDITGDGTNTPLDALALINSFLGISNMNSVYSAEVTGEGDINVADVVLLVNHGFLPEDFILR